ncbi:hypothetical protein OROMI_023049 [Orobanche minor]
MQKSTEEKLNPDYILLSEAKISQDLHAHLKLGKQEEIEAVDNHGDGEDEGEEEEEEEEEDEGEEEFSFMCEGANTSPIAAEDIFMDGQIRPIFPLFNRDLLFSGESLRDSLPVFPPVKKVFVQTNEENSPSASSSSDRKAVEASPSPEVCKKSNSTGFSKIWRFKDFLGRSNSDGRDAFVFLNNAHAPTPSAEQLVAAVKGEEKKGSKDKVKGKAKKGKVASLSAHEVYLRSKVAKEERRRSYLPYRPELMGFFTNVNGGLSKNVHPF